MNTLDKMAVEYRLAAAKLAMRIREKAEAGTSETELRYLRTALYDIRMAQRCLSGYYDLPRPPAITMSSLKTRDSSAKDA